MSTHEPRGLVVLDRDYAGNSGTLRDVRSDVVACLRSSIVDPGADLEERAQLVVSELATNAIQASPGRRYGLVIHVGSDRSVVVQVSSTSEHDGPPSPEAWGPATATAVSGRGLLIVGTLSDEVEIARPASGTVVVTATFRPTSRRPPSG
jgi:anti-sigma regulatory factor (Ser/Thr protein kinase)